VKVLPASLHDVILVEPTRCDDGRGAFMETFREDAYRDVGNARPFVQDNLSHSKKYVLRGLNFQKRQGKLVTVVHGEVFARKRRVG
jgi:dTDP-4-dehydrorhamnose 3,5-epimerase